MRVMLKGIHKLSRVNAKGETITYYYAWRGGPRIEAKPGTEAFLIEYASHICTLETNGIETLNNLIDHYLASPEYSALAISTKQSHQYAFRQIRKDYGSLPIHLIDAHGMKTELRNWRNKFVDRPRTADSLLNSFKRVLSHALENEFIETNPATGIKRIWQGSRKDSIWSTAQIEIMRQQAPEPIVRAMLLAYYTGQRQGDLLRLKWSDYDGIYLKLMQSKTSKHIKIRVHPKLKLYIDNLEKTAIRILTNTRSHPWTQSGFKSSWGKACKRAGIQGVTFHDLRGTFITERAREGATALQIKSVSGHSLKEINRTLEAHYLAEDQQASDAVILRMDKNK